MLKKRKNSKGSFKEKFKIFFLRLLTISFLGVVVWTLLFSDLTQIRETEIFSEKVDQKKATEILDSHRAEIFLQYFSRNNFFLFSEKKVAEKLKNEFEIIRSIDFKNKFPDKIIVHLEERSGVIIWRNQDKIFLLDETGEIFREAKEVELEGKFGSYDVLWDKSSLEVQEGQKIEDGVMVDFIKTLKEDLKKKVDLEIEKEMETPSLISKELRIQTKDGWKVYFDMESDLNDQVALLKEILETNFNSEERKRLEYIDLRVNGKAIYKMSGNRESSEGNEDSVQETEEEE